MLDGAITIGRGAVDRALADPDWSQFCRATVELTGYHARAIHVQNRGLGRWDGRTEENFVVVFSRLSDQGLVAVRFGLRQHARDYGQDAIALLIGTTELITPFTLLGKKEGAYAG